MPEADQLEWPQDEPLFEVQWRAISEGLAGNGVKDAGDFEVTATVNTRETSIAAGTAFYTNSETSLGAATTKTHSIGDGTNDRWDTLAWDTATSSVVLREGTPAANPEPPDLTGDEILLAVVKVPQNFDSAFDDATHIFNWRTFFSNEAEHTHYDDSTGQYGVSNVDAALDELQEAAQIGAYPLALADLANPFALPSITDMDVDSTNLTDGATVLYESANTFFPNEAVQALANLTEDEQFSAHPFGTADIDLSMTPTWTGKHTFDVGQEWQEIATPANPAAGYNKLYFKSDDILYKLDDGGNESTVGALILEDDQATIISATTAINAGAGIGVTDDGSGEGTLDYEHQEVFEGRESGSVASGNQGILIIDALADGATVEVYKAALTKADGTAVGSNTTLKLVTLDNAGGFTSQATLITGDGSTVFDRETGSPLGSHTNNSGSEQTIGVLVDNQETGSIDIMASAEGVTNA